MKPTASPLSQSHACRCGDAHPAVTRIGGFYVLACPKEVGEELRFVFQAPPKPSYLLIGESDAPSLEARVAHLEQNQVYLPVRGRRPKTA
jgi:hypothetical protein